MLRLFQHTAARRRLHQCKPAAVYCRYVSTHSRPKAAGGLQFRLAHAAIVSTHSRPKAAELRLTMMHNAKLSFNTQPPEGGCPIDEKVMTPIDVSTHSRPKAAVSLHLWRSGTISFQHTAARRRLDV